MGTISEHLISEIEREAKSTERILEAVPADKLDWKPHVKSMSLGDLAWHIAILPRNAILGLETGERDIATAKPSPRPADAGDIVAKFKQNIVDLRAVLLAWDDQRLLTEKFAFKNEGEVITAFPKAAFIRTVLMNHSIHHRGQLTVYLRLLDVPVPAMYGRTADENTFVKRGG
jgi:uncharacterized damage-inducible protein DinB